MVVSRTRAYDVMATWRSSNTQNDKGYGDKLSLKIGE